MTRLFNWISGLSFVLKFAFSGAVLLVLYFVVIEPALLLRKDLIAKADASSVWLSQYSEGADDQAAVVAELALGRSRYGDVAPPADFATRNDEFSRTVREILDENGIGARSETSPPRPSPLAPNTLREVLEPGQRVELVRKEIRFDATPEQFTAVLAALEQSEVIVGVSRLDIRRDSDGNRRVLVNLAVDSWVLSSGGATQ